MVVTTVVVGDFRRGNARCSKLTLSERLVRKIDNNAAIGNKNEPAGLDGRLINLCQDGWGFVTAGA